MAYPEPTEVAPWYLRNITQALELNSTTGQVFVRTGLTEGANITLTGNVTIPGEVDNHITAVGSLGNITTPYLPIGGNVNVDVITGNVTVLQGTSPWVVTGNTNVAITSGNVGITGNIAGITALPPITGNVGIVGNVNVAITSGNVGITGNIAGITTLPPITGNVNANVSGNVGIIGNVNVTQGTTPWSVTGNVTTTQTGTANVALGGTNLDAFGRLRVSNPVTLFDSQNLYVDGGQFSNITANSGSITYVPAQSSFNLSVTAANGSSVINQTKTTQPYLPGKSLLFMGSFAFATLAAGCRQRVGYFTASNGIYFEADGTTLYLVIRSSASGAVVEERIAQTSWNGDTLKTGSSPNPSGINLDPALTNIFWCDIEWLGVGNVRAGFIINGQFIVCHTFQHANQAGNTTVYMTSATLNPRYEITNTTATAGARTMKQICCTVISEGGYMPTPAIGYVSSGIQPTRLSTGNVYTNLATIRLNPACPDAVVFPAQVDLLLVDVQYGAWQLVVNASNVAGLTYANVNGGVVQANTSPVQIGDGTVVYSGVTSSRDVLAVGEDISRRIQLSRHANGTPITLTLCAGYNNNNADLIWRFGWGEATN